MYEFLKKYAGVREGRNFFMAVKNGDIEEAEERLGFALPQQLKEFYVEIGFGFLCAPKNNLETTDERLLARSVNRVIGPGEAADLYLGEGDVGPQEDFLPWLFPFFDLGEGTFLVLMSQDDDDKGVYWPDGKKLVAANLEEFFRKLHEDPNFYVR